MQMFEDRWVITDFAFQLSGGAVVNPPGSFECIAVSQTGDPVTGGWNFYSIKYPDGLGDYPKLGIWPDGIYMAVNMFAYVGGRVPEHARVRVQQGADVCGGPDTCTVVTFDGPDRRLHAAAE